MLTSNQRVIINPRKFPKQRPRCPQRHIQNWKEWLIRQSRGLTKAVRVRAAQPPRPRPSHRFQASPVQNKSASSQVTKSQIKRVRIKPRAACRVGWWFCSQWARSCPRSLNPKTRSTPLWRFGARIKSNLWNQNLTLRTTSIRTPSTGDLCARNTIKAL